MFHLQHNMSSLHIHLVKEMAEEEVVVLPVAAAEVAEVAVAKAV